MNTRCYRCGWSFSLSREAMEEAAVSSAGQKAHVIHCPKCRQTIRIPMDQVMRALPPGWAPDMSASAPAAAPAETAVSLAPVSEPAEAAADAPKRAERRHRRSSKTHSGDSAA